MSISLNSAMKSIQERPTTDTHHSSYDGRDLNYVWSSLSEALDTPFDIDAMISSIRKRNIPSDIHEFKRYVYKLVNVPVEDKVLESVWKYIFIDQNVTVSNTKKGKGENKSWKYPSNHHHFSKGEDFHDKVRSQPYKATKYQTHTRYNQGTSRSQPYKTAKYQTHKRYNQGTSRSQPCKTTKYQTHKRDNQGTFRSQPCKTPKYQPYKRYNQGYNQRTSSASKCYEYSQGYNQGTYSASKCNEDAMQEHTAYGNFSLTKCHTDFEDTSVNGVQDSFETVEQKCNIYAETEEVYDTYKIPAGQHVESESNVIKSDPSCLYGNVLLPLVARQIKVSKEPLFDNVAELTVGANFTSEAETSFSEPHDSSNKSLPVTEHCSEQEANECNTVKIGEISEDLLLNKVTDNPGQSLSNGLELLPKVTFAADERKNTSLYNDTLQHSETGNNFVERGNILESEKFNSSENSCVASVNHHSNNRIVLLGNNCETNQQYDVLESSLSRKENEDVTESGQMDLQLVLDQTNPSAFEGSNVPVLNDTFTVDEDTGRENTMKKREILETSSSGREFKVTEFEPIDEQLVLDEVSAVAEEINTTSMKSTDNTKEKESITETKRSKGFVADVDIVLSEEENEATSSKKIADNLQSDVVGSTSNESIRKSKERELNVSKHQHEKVITVGKTKCSENCNDYAPERERFSVDRKEATGFETKNRINEDTEMDNRAKERNTPLVRRMNLESTIETNPVKSSKKEKKKAKQSRNENANESYNENETGMERRKCSKRTKNSSTVEENIGIASCSKRRKKSVRNSTETEITVSTGRVSQQSDSDAQSTPFSKICGNGERGTDECDDTGAFLESLKEQMLAKAKREKKLLREVDVQQELRSLRIMMEFILRRIDLSASDVSCKSSVTAENKSLKNVCNSPNTSDKLKGECEEMGCVTPYYHKLMRKKGRYHKQLQERNESILHHESSLNERVLPQKMKKNIKSSATDSMHNTSSSSPDKILSVKSVPYDIEPNSRCEKKSKKRKRDLSYDVLQFIISERGKEEEERSHIVQFSEDQFNSGLNKRGRFNWKEAIIKAVNTHVTQRIPIDKLSRKVIYSYFKERGKISQNTIGKFQRYLRKIPGIKIDDDYVELPSRTYELRKRSKKAKDEAS